MNIKALESFEDIEKIDSFIIVIKSPDQREDKQFYQKDEKILRKSLTQSYHFATQQKGNRLKSQFLKGSENSLSIAGRALKKISYRTQLNAKIQKHTLLKQKCEQLIRRSPYKERCSSTNCLKPANSKKDHVSWLNYNSKLQVKPKSSNNLSSTSLQASKKRKFPRLTIRPLEIVIKNQNYSEKFILLKMLQNKEIHNTYLAQYQNNYFRCEKNNLIFILRIFAKETVFGTNRDSFFNEIRTQFYLNHSHIIKLYEVSSDNNFLYAFFEPGMNINLRQTLTNNGPLAERQVRKIIKQVLLAVDYLHKQNLAHLNIRPESIYYHQEIAKLGQFNKIHNFAKDYKKKMSFNVSDLFSLEENFLPSQFSDLWNIGILTYELLYGHPPIKFNVKCKQVGEIDPQIFKGNQALVFNEEIDVSDKAKEFISLCLDCKVSKKNTAKELSQHGFLVGGEKYRWTTA